MLDVVRAGAQPYLGARTVGWPGHVMADGVSPAMVRGRSFFPGLSC